MLFDGVLLASDYDGTLVPSAGRMTPGVERALRYFTENGGRFTVVTGRIERAFRPRLPAVVNAPVVLANGALIYDYGAERAVYEAGIGDEGVAPLTAAARAFPGVSFELHLPRMSYVLRPTAETSRHLTGQGIAYECVSSLADVPRPWTKALLVGSAEEIGGIQRLLASDYPEIAFLPTDGCYLEVLKRGVNKGAALQRLAERLRIAPGHVYAVGDGYNDVEMFRAAAASFAPENADAAARAAAGRIVRSNEDGALAEVVALLRERYRAGRADVPPGFDLR